MDTIDNLETAFEKFRHFASKHAEATEQGHSREANKCYNAIVKAINYIKSVNQLEALSKFLTDSSIGVRIWAASYLLPIKEAEALAVLKEIEKRADIHALTAKYTIEEWKKGGLKL